MIKPKIYLCELTNTGQTIATNCFPLSVGMIAAYLQKQLNGNRDIKIFKYPERFLDAISKEKPDILAFSNYMWNQNLNNNLAKLIKLESPETLIVYGGPNFPFDSISRAHFLKKNDFIDIYIFGEGEITFTELVKKFIGNSGDIIFLKKEGIQNCNYILDGKFIENPIRPRIKNLSEIPSPYTTGLFDEFFDGKLMPLVEFTRGCPFSCLYCDQSNPYHTPISRKNLSDVKEELEYIAKRFKGAKDLFIADSNFGMFDQDIEVAKLISEIKRKYDWPEYIQVATGKGKKKRVLEVAKILEGILRLGAAVQSMNPEVLKIIKRDNIPVPEIIDTVKKANEFGANTYSEIILALPGDSKKAHLESIRNLMLADVNFIRLFVLMLLQGTQIATKEFRDKFGLITKFRVLARGFGNYYYKDKKISSIEIEEIVVASNTLSFQDYLDCRHFAFTLELFYNDGIIDELQNILKSLGIPYFDLLINIDTHIKESKSLSGLKGIYTSFVEETKNELWDDESALMKYASDNLDKYIDGTLGSNLLFKYKALAFLNHLREIYEVAFDMLKVLVLEKFGSESYFRFLDDLKMFSFCKKDKLFEMKPIERKFTYDLISLERRGFKDVFNELTKIPRGKYTVLFYHDENQKRMIQSYLDKYGSDIIGLTRVFTRMMMKSSYRKVILKNKSWLPWRRSIKEFRANESVNGGWQSLCNVQKLGCVVVISIS